LGKKSKPPRILQIELVGGIRNGANNRRGLGVIAALAPAKTAGAENLLPLFTSNSSSLDRYFTAFTGEPYLTMYQQRILLQFLLIFSKFERWPT
jgi:hypothetical protein